MRLQLKVLAAFLANATVAHAQSVADIDLRSVTYQDTDRTTVVTSALAAAANPNDRFTVRAKYLVDVVSSASIDVVTAATGRFLDIRHEITPSAAFHDGTTTSNVAYVFSGENDWWANTGTAGIARDFANHQLTLGLSGSFTHNDVGRVGDKTFKQTLDQGSGTFDMTIIPSKVDVVSLGYTFVYLSGYQSSPYRFVRVTDPELAFPISVWESFPGTRTRHAVGLKWNHHVGKDSALRTHLRGYGDDWGIVSATGGAEYVIGVGAFDVAPFVRAYVQRGAYFYQSVYTTQQQYMSADRETSPFVDFFAGVRMTYEKAALRFDARLTGFYFKFFDFPRLPERGGFLAEVAFGVSF